MDYTVVITNAKSSTLAALNAQYPAYKKFFTAALDGGKKVLWDLRVQVTAVKTGKFAAGLKESDFKASTYVLVHGGAWMWKVEHVESDLEAAAVVENKPVDYQVQVIGKPAQGIAVRVGANSISNIQF
jgi:hypothetical protein